MSSHLLHRTPIRLADGRELIYFDETADRDRSAVDTRELPAVAHHSQARFDALAGEWVAIAGHRQTRTYHPPADQCPLCPSTAANKSEIPSQAYDVVVFENRFPSFSGQGPSVYGFHEGADFGGAAGQAGQAGQAGSAGQAGQAGSAGQVGRAVGTPAADPIEHAAAGTGRCEVVCFTSDHGATMSQLPDTRIRTVLQVWAERTAAIAQREGVEQVLCFENRGAEIGVTLDHPHGQIYGYPYLTPVTARMLESVAAYRHAHGGNLFADILAREVAGPRLIASNDEWVAFVPFAARWPIEVHLYPRRQVPDLPALTDTERDAFVPLYRSMLLRMEALFDDPLPLITAWHQAPVRAGREDWWAHLRLTSIRRAPGKIKYLAGSESAAGAFVSDVTPEDMAERLRRVFL